ncbi:hypothetical protein [Stutzerimonas azotifigens]|nr:hypothetical protein [Stutzerimonas azotifigens]
MNPNAEPTDQDPLDSPDDLESDGKNAREPEALPDDAEADGND